MSHHGRNGSVLGHSPCTMVSSCGCRGNYGHRIGTTINPIVDRTKAVAAELKEWRPAARSVSSAEGGREQMRGKHWRSSFDQFFVSEWYILEKGVHITFRFLFCVTLCKRRVNKFGEKGRKGKNMNIYNFNWIYPWMIMYEIIIIAIQDEILDSLSSLLLLNCPKFEFSREGERERKIWTNE